MKTMAWRSLRIDGGAWVLTLAGFGLLVAGVSRQWGVGAGLMTAGALLLWAGLRVARGTA